MEVKNTNTTNLLAIASEQANIEIMAMDGILKAYGSKKYAFYACVVSDGANLVKAGRYAELNDKEILEVRNSEQIRASQIGEYEDLVMLKHSEADLVKQEATIIKELNKLITDIEPDVVYTHNIFDKNPIHRHITKMVIEAINMIDEEARPRLLYGCEINRTLDWLPDKYKVTFDLSDNRELQARLVGVYDTRVEQYKNYTKAVAGRKMAHATFTDYAGSSDEEEFLWYGVNLSPVIQKDISLKDYCVKMLNDFNKDVLDSI